MTKRDFRVFLGAALLTAAPLFAGFASTESYLAAVGRVPGKNGAEFYTTVWATNLTTLPQTMTFQFLKSGQANTSPASFHDTLQPGQTKVYENVVETKLGLTNALGAARITSTGEIFVAERIYDQAPGDDLGNTEGLFFAGVPKSFSISASQSASIQGIDQGGAENFRYNFALIETSGKPATVNIQIFDSSGAMLGQKAYPLLPYEQIQPAVDDVVHGIATTNARLTATVTDGGGSVILAGAQVANESQDSSGFEMTFRDSLLGTSGGTAGVTSLDGLAGALTLKAGNGISITPSGSSISIAYTGGGGAGGITSVTHDASLAGNGTGASPLGIANGQLVRSVNGLHDNLTLAAGPNVTITPNGSTITIASSAGGGGSGGVTSLNGETGAVTLAAGSNVTITPSGSSLTIASASAGLTLPYFGSANAGGTAFEVQNTGGGNGITGEASSGVALTGLSSTGAGVYGSSTSGHGMEAVSSSNDGIHATSQTGNGVYGGSASGNGSGVFGVSSGDTGAGVVAVNYSTGPGIYAENQSGGYAGDFEGDVIVFGSLTVHGPFSASGLKDFVTPHPTDPSRQIVYTCIEGAESGTYFRGTGRIVNGFATIEVPEDFRLVTSPEGLTVQLTPLGGLAVLAVLNEDLGRIVVQGSSDVAFHYLVNGVRAGFEKHETIQANTAFVPRSADDPRLKGEPDGVRRTLEANGILNPDGSINLETARRLGWDRQESWNTVKPVARQPR